MATIKSRRRDKFKHSAAGRSKCGGQARKGGGGGKGTWGKAGDEYKYEDDDAYLGWQDPNYDEQDSGGFYFSSVPEKEIETAFAASIQMQKKFKEAIREAGRVYFVSSEKGEFAERVKETKMRDSLLYHEIVKELVRMSLDMGEKAMHSCSDLLRYLRKKEILDARHMYKGFYHLFNQVNDICMDVPKAKEKLLYAVECALLYGLTKENIDHLRQSLRKGTDQKTLKCAKGKIAVILKEYLDSEDVEELSTCFKEMKMPYLGFELIKQGVSLSMDRGPRERELISRMIVEVSGKVVPREETSKGFEVLLQRVEDLLMDVPKVLEYLSSFVARAVADEAVAPSLLLQAHIQEGDGGYEAHIQEGDGGYEVILQAQKLLKKSRAIQRLTRVWGPSSGDNIVTLKKHVRDLLLEYFSSGELKEAIRLAKCLPPHFHHEIVKRAFVISLDKTSREVEMSAKLLDALFEGKVTLKTQIQRGLKRIEASIDDMKLDNGKAPDIFKNFKKKIKCV
ncbi:hypothetical protein AAMO2058_000351100 [Amorphochlora amoebiformis]